MASPNNNPINTKENKQNKSFFFVMLKKNEREL